MGASCCCLRFVDLDDYADPNGDIYRHCICFRCFAQRFVSMYTALFQRVEVHALPSSVEGATALGPSALASSDNSLPDTFHPPPRPLPYDADPRCSHLHSGLVSRREKGSSHFHEESEPLRLSDRNSGAESIGVVDKLNGTNYGGGSKKCRSDYQSAKLMSSEAYILSSSEDEDVCPTCLEEYTLENPKIMTQCFHHFHLGCIYEWMERSETCPVCGKVMLFDETR